MMVILQVLHDGLTSIPLKETVWAQPTIAELGVDRVIVIPVNTLRDMYSTALMDVQENLRSFGEMWYQIFLWCLATSVFIHCISACVAFLALRKHSRGVFFPLLVVFIGFLYPVTGGVITSATIASVYETASFTMPGYASFLWGAGQAFIGFLVSYTRVLATL